MINDGSNVGRKNKESKVFPILYISLTVFGLLPSHTSCTYVKNFEPLRIPVEKQKIELDWELN